MSPVKGDEDDEATRASFIQGEVERAGTVQPRQKAQEGLTNVYKCLLKENFVERARLFSVVPSGRTRGSGHKLKYLKFHLDVKKKKKPKKKLLKIFIFIFYFYSLEVW